MVYNGKPYEHGWFGGTLFLETPICFHMYSSIQSIRQNGFQVARRPGLNIHQQYGTYLELQKQTSFEWMEMVKQPFSI